MTDIPAYLEILNPEQRKAVLHNGKSLLILAGAGSGKTRVITTKIAYLIRERGFDPRSILAVTFTNKAAREMAVRAQQIEGRAGDAMMRTFHSFGAWFLRRYAALAGINSNFVIYDDDDTISLLGTIDEDSSRPALRETAARISRAKDYFLSPEDPELDLIDYRPEFRKIYTRYEERLKKIGNADFGDLIKKPVEILRSNPDLARRLQERFRMILVDEYQDSNIAQFKLLAELTGSGTCLCVVGDDDQSIYRFRGAEVRNILEFPERFPGTDLIRLERNYRSFAPILTLASSVVDHNRGRLGKTLRAERGEGKLPTLAFLPDQDEEAAFCAELIQRSVQARDSGSARYADWAILYRTNAQSLGFETELLRRNIPYKVVGSLKFYQREEIKDALALLALLINPLDEVAFRRIINKPARGIGGKSLDTILETAFAASPPEGGLLAAARTCSLSAKAAAGIETFASFMDKAGSILSVENSAKSTKPAKAAAQYGASVKSKKSLIRAGAGLSVCAASLILDSGLAEYHSSHDEINGYQRLGNLQELVNAASLYRSSMEGLAEFLEHIELDRSIEENKEMDADSVTLITLHNTKGLEFRKVILSGLEQGVFPREDKEGDDMEEERRLFYVGATRAMNELYLCSCAFRRMYGRTSPMLPSRFLYEADKSSLRIIGSAPAGFGKISKSDGRPGRRPSVNAAKISSDGRWKQGDRLFHDDQGYGAVMDITETEDGPAVKVRYDNGQTTRFLSLYQSGNFTKMKDDD
ncbi:MAG: ATP-dependent helicase [Treponema sp.]|nr:ATP-dependent helicase [Treponema sp.]